MNTTFSYRRLRWSHLDRIHDHIPHNTFYSHRFHTGGNSERADPVVMDCIQFTADGAETGLDNNTCCEERHHVRALPRGVGKR